MDAITQLISNVGFPIAVCIGMGWFFKYMYDKNCDITSKMADAINNNTTAITKLTEKMDRNNDGK
jgi:hypothetical protein